MPRQKVANQVTSQLEGVSSSAAPKSRKRQNRRKQKAKPIGRLAAERRAKEMKASKKATNENPNSLVVNQDLNSRELAEPHHGQNLAEVWNLSGDEDAEEVENYKLTFENERTGEPIIPDNQDDEYDYPRPEANEI